MAVQGHEHVNSPWWLEFNADHDLSCHYFAEHDLLIHESELRLELLEVHKRVLVGIGVSIHPFDSSIRACCHECC